jgi:hypothetical protein
MQSLLLRGVPSARTVTIINVLANEASRWTGYCTKLPRIADFPGEERRRMTRWPHFLPDFTADRARRAEPVLFGTAGLSAVSAFATAPARSCGLARRLIPPRQSGDALHCAPDEA